MIILLRSYFFLFVCLLISSCSYKFSEQGAPVGRTAVSIPYIQGDLTGEFTDAIVQILDSSGEYRYQNEGGDYILSVEIVSINNDKIGYRYDRKGKEGKLQHNLIPTESRLTLSAKVVLLDAATDEVVSGPHIVSAFTDFDYLDTQSIKDLSVPREGSKSQTSISFSLGQLDSIEGAQGNAQALLYRKLAQKIVSLMHPFTEKKA